MLIIIPAVIAWQKTFTIEETALLNVKPTAIDPDLEEVSYEYGQPLNSSGQWQTGYDDAGEYDLQIIASDGQTRTTERIILIVTEKNRVPEISPLSIIAEEGETIRLHLPEQDLDGNYLQYAYAEPFNSDGTWSTSYHDAGKYTLIHKVSDGYNETEFQVNISLGDIDRAPFINLPIELVINEQEELSLSIDVLDPDGDIVELKAVGLPPGAKLSGETLEWTPSYNEVTRSNNLLNKLLDFLKIKRKAPAAKSFPVAITACSLGLCQTATTNLIVKNINQPPVISPIPSLAVKPNEKIKLNLSAVDLDGDLLIYSFSEPLDSSGVWKTRAGDEGEYQAFVSVSDGSNQTSIPISITVIKENQPPRLKAKISQESLEEGQTSEIEFKVKDPENDTVLISIENPPAGAVLEGLHFSWTPPYDTIKKSNSGTIISKLAAINNAISGQREVKELTFFVSDGLNKDYETLKLVIKDINQPPQIIDFIPDREITAYVDEPVIFNLAAKDLDHDQLEYEWIFSLHEPRIKGTNTVERIFVAPGKKKIHVVVSDGTDSVSLTWKVNVIEREPEIEEQTFRVYTIG